ncbi:hypothetical protein GCM10009734_20010 [Nonomuraea bangladeshensis]
MAAPCVAYRRAIEPSPDGVPRPVREQARHVATTFHLPALGTRVPRCGSARAGNGDRGARDG